MPLYSCAIVGTGSDADPIRPPFSGDGIGWICLGPPGSTSGRGLLYLPEPSLDSRVRKIADDPLERPTLQTRRAIENELGVTLAAPNTTDLAALFAELLLEHGRTDGTRWGILRPSRARRQHEIWLGALGVIWRAPAKIGPSTQTYTETWPTDSTTISSGQDEPWTEALGNAEVSGGKLRPTSTTGVHVKCDSLLDTSDQYHEATFALALPGGETNNCNLMVRYSDSSNHYRSRIQRGATFIRIGEKRVAGVNTTIVTDSASDPGASGVARTTIDGSTMTIVIGAYSANGTDGSPQLLTNLNVGAGVFNNTTVGNATLDDHTFGDVAAGVSVPSIMHNYRRRRVT